MMGTGNGLPNMKAKSLVSGCPIYGMTKANGTIITR